MNNFRCEYKMVRTALTRALRVSVIRYTDEYARETSTDVIDLHPGERDIGNTTLRTSAKIHKNLNNRKVVLLLDTGAEVSILDTTFAREVGCQIDTSVTQDFVGIGDETYFSVGRPCVKVTLAGNIV
ncbi:Eukaryotic/viral aspartic protease [Phytophthora megakarya]|uniref:Eukaryotic/viral aspartic protease n=1 Tax=Phytophthora megakarya TaxID=4795 RepID=A0A225WV13_9STRA|nr:Eukaryotic/viral aspartic protease [Phytophthora megakarya]